MKKLVKPPQGKLAESRVPNRTLAVRKNTSLLDWEACKLYEIRTEAEIIKLLDKTICHYKNVIEILKNHPEKDQEILKWIRKINRLVIAAHRLLNSLKTEAKKDKLNTTTEYTSRKKNSSATSPGLRRQRSTRSKD